MDSLHTHQLLPVSVAAVRHRFLVACCCCCCCRFLSLLLLLSLFIVVGVEFIFESRSRKNRGGKKKKKKKRFNVLVVSGRLSLVFRLSVVVFVLFVDLEAERWMDGRLFTYVA